MRNERDVCNPGRNKESAEAHESIKAHKERVRQEIYAYALRQGHRGITTDEVAIDRDAAPNQVSGRLTELKITGHLVPTDRRRKTRTGRWARVLVAVKVSKRQ